MSLQRMKGRLQGFVGMQEIYERQDLRSANAYGSTFSNCTFKDCKMSVASFQHASLQDVTFDGCQGLLSNFTLGRQMRSVTFRDCDLEQADFTGTVMDGVVFERCRLWGAVFRGVTGKELDFDGCNLHGADLRFHLSLEVSYSDCNLWGAVVPLGCAFFNATFDERGCQQLLSLVGRIYPDVDVSRRIMELAGDQYKVVERLMRSEAE